MKKIAIIIAAAFFASCGTKQTKTKPADKDTTLQNINIHNKGNVDYETYFTSNTMRVDYCHTGKHDKEIFGIDRVLNDSTWPGSKTQLIDTMKLGLYFYEVIDAKTSTLLYSRGFASVFGEWQLTDEAKDVWKTFHESLRFPWPKLPVKIILSKRNAKNIFEPIWTTEIDPALRAVNKGTFSSPYKSFTIQDNGNINQNLDFVILGDGYSIAEMEKFRKDAQRLSKSMLDAEPFNTYRDKINVRLVETPALSSGVSKPHHKIYKRTPLSVHYSSFDSERYALTYDNRTIRDVASTVPYDFMIILINEKTYGGGGIYNLYTTVAVDNKFSEYIMIHEMGHCLAGLADEYYTSAVAYETPNIELEPWELNVTALFDKNNIKWKHLIDKDVPIPTPWNKKEFDEFGYMIQKKRDSIRANYLPESVMEALLQSQLQKENELFANEKYKDKVGAFEGANYCAKGMYRSQLDCIMFTRHTKFCKVCQDGLSRVIQQYIK